MTAEPKVETVGHEYVVPSGRMTDDPALLGRWFCVCGAVLDRTPSAAEALRRHRRALSDKAETAQVNVALVEACEGAICPCGHEALDHAWHGCENCLCNRSGIHAVLASGVAVGGTTVTEWGHRYPDGSIIADSSEVVAKSRAAINRGPGGRPLTLMRRAVTDWMEADHG